MPSALSKMIRVTLILLVLAALVWLARPAIDNALRYSQLLREPPPIEGTLPNPLPGQSFVDTWGAARSAGRSHEGVDIFAPEGTPVVSTTRGLVSQVGTNGLGGMIVTVIGPAGYRHYYAHLSGYGDVRVGQWIEPGTVLGFVGNTGNARGTPPHLHYGVYRPGWDAVNPYPLLQAAP